MSKRKDKQPWLGLGFSIPAIATITPPVAAGGGGGTAGQPIGLLLTLTKAS